MVMKFGVPALACALTLGLATEGYAQSRAVRVISLSPGVSVKSVRSAAAPSPTGARFAASLATLPLSSAPLSSSPNLITWQQAFNMTDAQAGQTRQGAAPQQTGPRSLAITNQSVYENFPNTADGGVFFGNGLVDVLDDVALPYGITSGVGVTVTSIFAAVGNPGTAAQPIHGVLTIYDKLDYANTTNIARNVIATFPFDADYKGVATVAAGRVAIIEVTPGAATPLVLTHDLGTTGSDASGISNRAPYGVEVALFSDAAHTVPSPNVYPLFSSSTQVQVGRSVDFAFRPASGVFTTNNTSIFAFQGYPSLTNLTLEINGTSPNDLTYNVSSTLNFPALPSGAPRTEPIKITFHDTTDPTAKDFTISGTVTVTDVLTSRGTVASETATLTLTDFKPDNYTVTYSSTGFTPVIVPIAFTTTDNTQTPPVTETQNVYPVVNFVPVPTETVTGSVALEGVSDLSNVSPSAPLGNFTVSFYTPGSIVKGAVPPTTPVYTQSVTLTTTASSENGAYTVTGVPDGTYDVVVKGAKNLAVLSPGVVISATSTTVPNVILPAGDSNNDDSVDSSDFGTLIGAFNTDGSVAGSGYDPTVDFNFDGLVDSSDFGLLIGEFNNTGAI